MDEFCFEPGYGREDLEAARQALHLRSGHENWLFAAGLHNRELLPTVAFAGRRVLDLFGCLNLEELSSRLFSSPEPGAQFFLNLSQVQQDDSVLRIGKSRFFLQPAGANLTVLWRRVSLRKDTLFLVVALVDVPHTANTQETGIWPDLSGLELMVSPDEIARGFSFEATVERWAKGYPGQSSVRFTWTTNAEQKLISVSSALEDVAGPLNPPLLGREFLQALSSYGISVPERILRDFAEHRSFSEFEFLWPFPNAGAAIPVKLGAFPCFDEAAIFSGYRGFGVINLDEAVKINVGPSLAREQNGKPPSKAEILLPEQPQPPASFASIGSAPAANPLPSATNIVALHPMRQLKKDEAEDMRLEPALPELFPETEKTALTPGEEEAFREIALALGGSSPSINAETETENPLPQASAGSLEAELPLGDNGAEAKNLKGVLDVLPFGILVCTAQSVLYANRALLDFLEFSDLDTLKDAQTELFSFAPNSEQIPVRLRNASGQELSFSAETSPANWAGQDALTFAFKLGPPLESANGHEAKIRQYEREARELHTILDTATDGVAVIDEAGKILALNRSGEALFGYDQIEVLGKPFTTLVAPESRFRADEYLQGLKDNGVFSLLNDGREILGLARQGGVIPLFVTLGRISDSRQHEGDDQIAGKEPGETKYCALLRDLTHWKKVEQELDEARAQAERASALKSDFLAKVSHEIRTPLNAILGFAEVIIDERFGPLGNERYRDYLKDIHASGALVMSIVNDLLDLSKIEAGKMDLEFVAVDANQIVADCVSIMQPQANRERVIMRLALSQNLPLVSADERSLRQIILNLLSNAIKFNEPGGQVIVATRLTDARQIIIRIRDTGLGMSDEDIKIALEPFRQLATSRPSGGTGLGLPLTKALIEANRAYFSIKSKKQEGTMVEITFPSARIFAE